VLGSLYRWLDRLTGAPPRLLWRARQWLQARRLARLLPREDGYSFTTDFTAPVRSEWERVLGDMRGRPGLRMLEIGSYEGRSAIWFLENVLTDPDASITCVDPFLDASYELRFDHNLRWSGLEDRVTKLKGFSEAVLPQLPLESFDLVYVDGNHRAVNVLMDAVLAWRRLRPGGRLIFDDYRGLDDRPPHMRPQMAIDLFLETFEGEYELLLKDYQVAVKRRATLRTSAAP
jgi:SAM-dependent methyltransferase